MSDQQSTTPDPNAAFDAKAENAIRGLFERAKAIHELHFAMALMPEFRGVQDAGWSTAHEAVKAYDEFVELIKRMDRASPIRIRVVLAFYNHLAEGSGFYETPKKLLLTISGRGNNIYPFQSLVDRHKMTGEVMAPNANRIMKDLIGHASELGLTDLAEVIRDAFDPDVRNAVAHADYIIWSDGLRLRRRNGGQPRVIPWDEFDSLILRGLNLFSFFRAIQHEYTESYNPPKMIRARLNDDDPEDNWTIYSNPDTGAFGITTGQSPPKEP